MDRVPVKYAELHSNLFFGGKSHGSRLDSFMSPGVTLQLDREVGAMYITYKGPKFETTGAFPLTSFVYWIEGETPQRGDKKIVKTELPSAQVATPQSHVHAGPGSGKMGVFK